MSPFDSLFDLLLDSDLEYFSFFYFPINSYFNIKFLLIKFIMQDY